MARPDFRVERLETYTEQDARDLGVMRNALSSDRSSDRLTDRRIRSIVERDDRVFIVARDDESQRITGCETLVTIPLPEAEDDDPDGVAWLGFVATRPDQRGKGVTKHVALEGLTWCVEQGLTDIKFTSNPNNPERANARAFYIKYGAKIIAEAVEATGTDLYWWNVGVGIDRLTASLS